MRNISAGNVTSDCIDLFGGTFGRTAICFNIGVSRNDSVACDAMNLSTTVTITVTPCMSDEDAIL
jgi:hypothetical protein